MTSPTHNRLSSPATYKHLLHQIQSEFKPSRLYKDLDRFVGRKVTGRRWASIRLKYNIKEAREPYASTDVILKVNMRERLKSETRSYEKKRLQTEMRERLAKNRVQVPQFFKFTKKSIRYLQQSSPKNTKSFQLPRRLDRLDLSWINNQLPLSHKRINSNIEVKHPILDLYTETSEEVIKSIRAKEVCKSPFGWFARADELHPY